MKGFNHYFNRHQILVFSKKICFHFFNVKFFTRFWACSWTMLLFISNFDFKYASNWKDASLIFQICLWGGDHWASSPNQIHLSIYPSSSPPTRSIPRPDSSRSSDQIHLRLCPWFVFYLKSGFTLDSKALHPGLKLRL